MNSGGIFKLKNIPKITLWTECATAQEKKSLTVITSSSNLTEKSVFQMNKDNPAGMKKVYDLLPILHYNLCGKYCKFAASKNFPERNV